MGQVSLEKRGGFSKVVALETGYCAPEITDASMSTQLADVYSFGVVLLELLTGKSAVLTSTRTGNCSLAQWIQVALKTEWTTDLINPNLQRSVIIDAQILKLFRIALSCVEAVPDQRPKMSDLIPLMQKILHESDLV